MSARAQHLTADLAAAAPLTQPKTACCFDVFDTVLTRAVGNPIDVFLLLGRRLFARNLIACYPEVFSRLRSHSEDRANTAIGQHSTLPRIYNEVVRGLGLSASMIPVLMNEELSLERELSRKVPSADNMLENARRRSGSATFVTDTNFPTAFIQELLEAQGLWRAEDRIFASCDFSVDKAHGMMFPHVARTLGVHPRRIVHTGNDAVADVRNGKLSAWRVVHSPAANLNRYESALAGYSFDTGGLSSLFAGASRQARLQSDAATGRERALFSVAAGVMAPTLTAWTMWTMRQAVQSGCRRLHFISRDGQVLLEIARKLELVMNTGLDLRYLYGGRQAIICAVSPSAAIRDVLRLEFCSLSEIADLLGCSRDEFTAFLWPGAAKESSWDRVLSAEDRRSINALLEDPAFQAFIERRSRQERETFLAYLRQEGWDDGSRFGLVDVGWRGSMAKALHSVVAGTSLSMPHAHFYFGLSDDSRTVAGSAVAPKMQAWFFDAADEHGNLPYLQSTTSLIEMFCAADHGPVSGYRYEGETVVPMLRSKTSPMEEWGLPILRTATNAFLDFLVDSWRRSPDLVDTTSDIRPAIKRVLELFWLDPTPEEVKHWGTFPVEVNLNNTECLPLVMPVSTSRFVRSLAAGKTSFRHGHTWPRGTQLASPWPYRQILSLAWRLRKKLPAIRKRAHWFRLQLLLLAGKA